MAMKELNFTKMCSSKDLLALALHMVYCALISN